MKIRTDRQTDRGKNMRETIYLVVTSRGVDRMTKKMPQNLHRTEFPVKLSVVIDEKALRVPILEREVVIENWRDGVDLADVEFRESVITPAEVEMIRASRIERMKELLIGQGYTVERVDVADNLT